MTNNLGRTDVLAAQNQKEVTIGESDGFLDAAITAQLDVTVTNTNAATITQLQLQRHATFNILPDGGTPPTAAITITIDTAFQRGNFTVVNETAQSVTVTIAAQTATAPVIPAGETFVCNLDGADVRPAGGGGGGGGGISGIDLEDEGVAVPNTPHTRFNFTGAGVTVTDVNGTEATINVPGGGSGVELEDEGVAVTGTPHSRLNFTGTGVTVTNVDGTEATVDIPGGGTGVELEDEGVAVTGTPHARLNFTGAGVTVTNVDGTEATINIPGGGGGGTREVLIVEDERTNGTGGGNPANNTDYLTRTLNTIRKNTITGASVTSNVITLPAGTYYIEASAPAYRVTRHKARFRNTTANTTTILGTTERSGDLAQATMSRSFIRGEFTIAASTNFELQHRVDSVPLTNGFGFATFFGDAEIYSSVFIEKVG